MWKPLDTDHIVYAGRVQTHETRDSIVIRYIVDPEKAKAEICVSQKGKVIIHGTFDIKEDFATGNSSDVLRPSAKIPSSSTKGKSVILEGILPETFNFIATKARERLQRIRMNAAHPHLVD